MPPHVAAADQFPDRVEVTVRAAEAVFALLVTGLLRAASSWGWVWATRAERVLTIPPAHASTSTANPSPRNQTRKVLVLLGPPRFSGPACFQVASGPAPDSAGRTSSGPF